VLKKHRKNICAQIKEHRKNDEAWPPFKIKVKNRLGDQRGGEWMGADKNSSPKRELGTYPKFTTKITTWVCQGHIVTLDLHTQGTNPKRS
jgi:hypothetical protein